VGKGSTFSFSVEIPMHEEAAQEYVRSRSADSLSLRRKSESTEPVVVDNKDALLASADRGWARRHSLATTSSSSSSSSSSSTSSPRKRRPNTQSLPQQTSRPRRQRANSLKSQAEPQGHDHSSSSVTPAPCPSSRSRRRHSNDNGDHNRDHNEARQAAPELDLYNNGGSGDQAGATQEDWSGAAPVRAKSEDELMANTTATSAAASEKAAATERRGGSVIVMSSSTGRSGDRALDKEQTKLQELYQGLQGTRVLLVEDNVVNQKVAKLMLTSLGCEVTIASNGQIGLDLVAQRVHDGAGEAFDVVLMDLQMPVMDGFIASTRIRELERAEKRPRTPIVTLTASTTSEYQERCTACGMDGWLSKPFNKEQLATVIATWTHKYHVSTPPPSSSESETPSSPEFSPPSDDGFDAVPAAQNATVEPTTANNAAGQTDHPHDHPQRQNRQIKQLRAETASMPIPSSASAEHLSSTHHFAAAAERSSLLRSSSA
jgi:CheY-like chemotaxis protein